MNKTMWNAFISRLEKLAGETQGPAKFVVRGPNEEMLPARMQDFKCEENGVEIADEFIIGWDGILAIEVNPGTIFITLVDGKTVDIEVIPE